MTRVTTFGRIVTKSPHVITRGPAEICFCVQVRMGAWSVLFTTSVMACSVRYASTVVSPFPLSSFTRMTTPDPPHTPRPPVPHCVFRVQIVIVSLGCGVSRTAIASYLGCFVLPLSAIYSDKRSSATLVRHMYVVGRCRFSEPHPNIRDSILNSGGTLGCSSPFSVSTLQFPGLPSLLLIVYSPTWMSTQR